MATTDVQPQQQTPPSTNGWHTALGFLILGAIAVLIFWVIGALAGGGDDGPFDPMTLDDSGYSACQAFATEHGQAITTVDRERLANEVNVLAGQSGTHLLADNAKPLQRTFDGSQGAWDLASNVFSQTCLDRGWGK